MSYTAKVARLGDDDLTQQLKDASKHVEQLRREASRSAGGLRARALDAAHHAETMHRALLTEYRRRGLGQRTPA